MSPAFRIELSHIDYLPGEVVTGWVIVTEPGHSRRLQVSLSFRELSAKTFTARSRHVPGPVLYAGRLQLDAVMPFSIQVPNDALPNAVGPHGALFWTVDVHSQEFGPDTEEYTAIRVQLSHLAFQPEHGEKSSQPSIDPDDPDAAEPSQPGQAPPMADQGEVAASGDRPVRGFLLALLGAIGALLWGGAAALELLGVVEFGENASPIGKAPTIVAAVVGLIILMGVLFAAVAQTPAESRAHRIPALFWLALVACTATGLVVIAVRSGLFIPGGSGILLFIFLFLALKARREG